MHAPGLAVLSFAVLVASLQPVRDHLTPPFFSVIVLTWTRTEFVEQAIRSVLAQSVPRGQYEILLIRGYHDPALDATLVHLGVKLLRNPSPNQGVALTLGVTAASGQVLVFLDDDDQFEPTKLAALRAAYEADPTLVAVRNGNRCIDRDGRPLSDWPSCWWPALPTHGVDERREPDAKLGAPTLPMHNLSSLSVRRDAVLGFIPRWADSPLAADSLVFLSALGSHGTVRSDPRVLTRRRVHSSNSMESYFAEGVGPPLSFQRLEQLDRSHAAQLRMVERTPARNAAQWVYLIHRFEAAMTSVEFPSPSPRDFFSLLKGAARERQPFRLWIAGFALLRRFFPRHAVSAWWSFCNARQRRQTPRIDFSSLFRSRKDGSAAAPAPRLPVHRDR